MILKDYSLYMIESYVSYVSRRFINYKTSKT